MMRRSGDYVRRTVPMPSPSAITPSERTGFQRCCGYSDVFRDSFRDTHVMGIVERAKDAWSVLRGRKSLSEVGETLASWFHGRSATVTGWQFKAAKLLAEE